MTPRSVLSTAGEAVPDNAAAQLLAVGLLAMTLTRRNHVAKPLGTETREPARRL